MEVFFKVRSISYYMTIDYWCRGPLHGMAIPSSAMIEEVTLLGHKWTAMALASWAWLGFCRISAPLHGHSHYGDNATS